MQTTQTAEIPSSVIYHAKDIVDCTNCMCEYHKGNILRILERLTEDHRKMVLKYIWGHYPQSYQTIYEMCKENQ